MDSSVSSAPALRLSGATLPLTRGAGAGLGWGSDKSSSPLHSGRPWNTWHKQSSVMGHQISSFRLCQFFSALPIISLVSPVWLNHMKGSSDLCSPVLLGCCGGATSLHTDLLGGARGSFLQLSLTCFPPPTPKAWLRGFRQGQTEPPGALHPAPSQGLAPANILMNFFLV